MQRQENEHFRISRKSLRNDEHDCMHFIITTSLHAAGLIILFQSFREALNKYHLGGYYLHSDVKVDHYLRNCSFEVDYLN